MYDEISEQETKTITIQTHRKHWDCGDGCCSSSWYEGSLSVNGDTLFEIDYENPMSKECLIARLLEDYVMQETSNANHI